MTTIAYHKETNTVAIDSRYSSCGTISTDDGYKVVLDSGNVWFLSGKPIHYSEFIALFDQIPKSSKQEVPKHLSERIGAIVVSGGVAYIAKCSEDEGVYTEMLTHDDAIGSGWDWAVAAMDFGRNAEGAIEYAKTRCMYTGGNVHVYDIPLGRFIK